MIPAPAREVLGACRVIAARSRGASEILERSLHVAGSRTVGRPGTAETVGDRSRVAVSLCRLRSLAPNFEEPRRRASPCQQRQASFFRSSQMKPSPRTVTKAMVGLKATDR